MSVQRTLLSTAIVATLALSVAACSPDATPEPAITPATDAGVIDPPAADVVATPDATATCNADAVQSLVGQTSTDALVEQARTDSGANSVRVLKPGDAATMDYREDRLNIELDDAGAITALRCG